MKIKGKISLQILYLFNTVKQMALTEHIKLI